MAALLDPDICIIGAGPAGLAVATAARAHGASVVLVAREPEGGERVRAGSAASKAFVAAARHAHAMRNAGAFGLAAVEPVADYARVQAHVQQVVDGMARDNSVERFEALGIKLVAGTAKFLDPKTIKAGDTLIRARRFVLATGSRPSLPPIPGLQTVPYLTDDTAFTLTQKPTHLVIIGGGPLAMELAQAHRRLGAAVTVIEASTPLAQSDPELVDIALRRMQEEGVVIRSGTNVVSVAPGAAGRGIELTLGGGDVSETIVASHLLIAVGRELNLNELDLDKANVKRDPLDGAMLALRSYFKTSNRRVYAVGALMANAWSDAAAAHQAQAVVRHALLGMPIQYDRQLVPLATYCDPEIAEVGLTEPMARKRLRAGYKVVRCAFADNARARAERQSFGLAKLVTDRDGRILGAGIVGANAGELIALFSFAIANRLSTHHLRVFVPAHPTFSEIVRQLGTESAHDQPPSPWVSRLMALNRLLP